MNAPPDAIEELCDHLADELDSEELAAFDTAQELWDSDEHQRAIEPGDFSSFPESVRPE